MILHIGDNLEVLRSLPERSIDLIYLDPPYSSQTKQFNAVPGSIADGAYFIDRKAASDYKETLVSPLPPQVAAIVKLSAELHSKAMAAYLCDMAPRLIEMHRLLKDTGNLLLHCDTSADYLLRALLDAIFGQAQFRNAIVWSYTGVGKGPKHFLPRKHDTILWYGKTAYNYFKQPFWPLGEKQVKGYNRIDESGRRYRQWNAERRSYLDRQQGRIMTDAWSDIHNFSTRSRAKERTGWPTQKPLQLLERIVEMTCPPGGKVLDPYCGSGTTLVAAHSLGNEFVGIDLHSKSAEVIQHRFGNLIDIKVIYG